MSHVRNFRTRSGDREIDWYQGFSSASGFRTRVTGNPDQAWDDLGWLDRTWAENKALVERAKADGQTAGMTQADVAAHERRAFMMLVKDDERVMGKVRSAALQLRGLVVWRSLGRGDWAIYDAETDELVEVTSGPALRARLGPQADLPAP